MDAFLTREGDAPQSFTIDGLIATLLQRLNVHEFFSFTYKAAITSALIYGEANLIGQYIEENYTLKLDIDEGTATLFHDEEQLELYPLELEDFEAHLETIRQEVASPTSSVHTPESLADALVESIWGDNDVVQDLVTRERLVQPYLSCIIIAVLHGDCRVAGPMAHRFDLVVHSDRPTASLCKDDEVIDSFKLDAEAFQVIRDQYAALSEEAE